MAKLPLSVFIITQDEEKNIQRAIKSVEFADEIIVVDSGSTDKTLEILESLGITVIHQDWQGYARQKQFAMQQCRNDWVLNLDADEEVTVELAERIKSCVIANDYSSMRFLRADLFINKFPSPLSKHPNNIRLFLRKKASFDANKLVHESASVTGRELFVREKLNHYGYCNIELLTKKNNHYSTLKALAKHQQKKSYSTLKLMLIFPFVFIQQWLFNRKIFSGKRGFILSIIEAHYAFLKEAKLYEHSVSERTIKT